MKTSQYIALLIFQFFICTVCFAQRERIDSLEKILPSLKDSARINCLNELSEAYKNIQTDTARIYAKQALKAAEKISYIPGIAKAYKNLGRIECILITDLKSAEKYFDMSLALFLTTKDEAEIAWAWHAVGYSRWVLCKFPEAIDAFEKSVQLLEREHDTSTLVQVYDYMYLAAKEWGHYEKALQYALKHEELTGKEDYGTTADFYTLWGDYDLALEYFRKDTSTGQNGLFNYFALGSTFYLKKQYDSAIHYYKLFEYWARAGRPGALGKFDANLGELHIALRHYDSALVYLNAALNSHKKASDNNQVMRVLLLLGKAYKEKGAYKSSKQTAQELLQMAYETGARQYSRDCHLLLYDLFEQFKMPDSAYIHLRQYTLLKDSIDRDVSAQRLLMYKIKSEKELKAQSKIYAINEEKKLQQQKLKQNAQEKKVFIAGIIALLLMGVILFRNFILKRKNEKLRLEHELELQKLENDKTKSELQQQASELEMQALRAQMNPHFIFNSLNSINMFILENNKLQASEYLSKFSRLVRLILQNSQEVFIPLDKELEALRLYLELEALRFEQKFEYKITVSDEVDTTMIKVPPLIIQPYAENAIWHGLMHLPDRKAGNKEKGHLEIELYIEGKILFCKITDDGVGRKKAAELKSKSSLTYKSMGMRITADRIAILQQQKQDNTFVSVNDLVFPDNSPAGTEVLIKIPVQYD